MLKNLSLPVKVSIIFFPLFFAAVALISYFNYSATQEQMMFQVQNGAMAQATTIREALVNMMVTNERIDDKYLQKVSSSGDIRDISILFRLDSLHFDEERLEDDEVRTRLIRREVEVWDKNKDFGKEVFSTKTPQWFLTCKKKIHETKMIANLSADKPALLRSCEEMEALIPFVAEKKCTNCHNVEIGSVLGAAVMRVPLEATALHLEANAYRSLYVFIGFMVLSIVLNGFVFRQYINNPLKKLIAAAEAIGSGKKIDHSLSQDFANDEIGKLAVSFENMQKNLERVQGELVRGERLSAVGQMASSIVHDFRTPMTTLSLTADYLQRNADLEPEQRKKKFEQLHSSVRKMNDMMQELLDYSKGDFELNYEPVPVESFAESLQNEFEPRFETSNIRFAVSCRCGGSMRVDNDRLYRVLANIINNAHDAIQEQGMISVLIEEKNGDIRFVVEDTGKGIPEEIRAGLFEPFVTSGKKNGTGLGLAIVKRIVELHKGMISFSSEVGKGSEFVVTIPRKPAV
jgi:signal transduction histidine kinase